MRQYIVQSIHVVHVQYNVHNSIVHINFVHCGMTYVESSFLLERFVFPLNSKRDLDKLNWKLSHNLGYYRGRQATSFIDYEFNVAWTFHFPSTTVCSISNRHLDWNIAYISSQCDLHTEWQINYHASDSLCCCDDADVTVQIIL